MEHRPHLHIGRNGMVNKVCIPAHVNGTFDILFKVFKEENFRTCHSKSSFCLPENGRVGLVKSKFM